MNWWIAEASTLSRRSSRPISRPYSRVLIPPAPARPHSVDLLLCGHHYRASGAALAAAGAVIMDDQRSGGTIITKYELRSVPSDATPRR